MCLGLLVIKGLDILNSKMCHTLDQLTLAYPPNSRRIPCHQVLSLTRGNTIREAQYRYIILPRGICYGYKSRPKKHDFVVRMRNDQENAASRNRRSEGRRVIERVHPDVSESL